MTPNDAGGLVVLGMPAAGKSRLVQSLLARSGALAKGGFQVSLISDNSLIQALDAKGRLRMIADSSGVGFVLSPQARRMVARICFTTFHTELLASTSFPVMELATFEWLTVSATLARLDLSSTTGVYLTCSRSVSEARQRDRYIADPSGFNQVLPTAVMDLFYEAGEPPEAVTSHFRYFRTLDTSEPDADMAALLSVLGVPLLASASPIDVFAARPPRK